MTDRTAGPDPDDVVELFAGLDMRGLVESVSSYLAGNGDIAEIRREAIAISRGVHTGRIPPHTMLVAVQNAIRVAGIGAPSDGRTRMTAKQLAPWLIELVFDPDAAAPDDTALTA